MAKYYLDYLCNPKSSYLSPGDNTIIGLNNTNTDSNGNITARTLYYYFRNPSYMNNSWIFTDNSSFCSDGSVKIVNAVVNCDGTPNRGGPGVSYSYRCENMSYYYETGYIKDGQLNKMGKSFITAGSGLLHIGIQLLPYLIVLTIILIVFGLVKNWSKLRGTRQMNRIKRQKTRNERREIKRYSKKR